MIRMMARGKIAHSKHNVFILEGSRYKEGLYRFKGGKLPVGEDFRKGKGRVEMIQRFVDEPVLPPKWDWRGKTAEKVRRKFTPEYIWNTYIAKALEGIMPGRGK
jgi:hypothetical protein